MCTDFQVAKVAKMMPNAPRNEGDFVFFAQFVFVCAICGCFSAKSAQSVVSPREG